MQPLGALHPLCRFAHSADRRLAQAISATNVEPALPMRLELRPHLRCSPPPSLHFLRRPRLPSRWPNPPRRAAAALTKYLVGCLVFILLIVLAVMGSCAYIGYRAKKKADEISQAYKSNDLNKLAGALGVGSKGASGVPRF